jgi:hypothetical protein
MLGNDIFTDCSCLYFLYFVNQCFCFTFGAFLVSCAVSVYVCNYLNFTCLLVLL